MPARPKSASAIYRRTTSAVMIALAAAAISIASSGRGLAKQTFRASQSSQSANAAAGATQNPGQQNQTAPPEQKKPPLPRGKKLILKDGSVQLVREYQVMDDRVRFYSTERSQWEEMPGDLIDWDATRQSEVEQKKGDAALLASVHKQEQVRRVMALDVDASLEAAPGVFIPPGEGLFVYDGKSVLRLTQAQADNKVDKKQVVKQILVPIPVVPSRHNITIPRPHAEVRVRNEQPEFYMRTGDARDPEMLLIHAKVNGDTRLIEHVDTYFSAIDKTKRSEILAQKWPIAKGVYRFTINESLEPGEYVFTEIVKAEGTNLYVWDFGVDVAGKPSATDKKNAK